MQRAVLHACAGASVCWAHEACPCGLLCLPIPIPRQCLVVAPTLHMWHAGIERAFARLGPTRPRCVARAAVAVILVIPFADRVGTTAHSPSTVGVRANDAVLRLSTRLSCACGGCSIILLKSALELCFLGPCMITSMYTWNGLLTGMTLEDVARKCKRDLVPAWKVAACCFGPAGLINYAFVPLR